MYFSEFFRAFISIIYCNTVAKGSVNGTFRPIHIEWKQRRKRKRSQTIEFFLNVLPNLLNSVTKIFVITIKGFEPATSCVKDQDVTTARTCKTHVTNSISKLTSIYASVIYQIPRIHWIPVLLMETLICSPTLETSWLKTSNKIFTSVRSHFLSVGIDLKYVGRSK